MWGEFCGVFSPNSEKQELKSIDAVAKYTTRAMVRYYLKKILRKNK